MVLYIVTVTAFNKNIWISKDNLDDVIRWLSANKNITISNAVYETSGLYNQLHIHALATVNYGFKYASYTKYGDDEHCIAFKVHWRYVKHAERDKSRIMRYLSKDSTNAIEQEQILILNYYKGNYYDCTSDRFTSMSEMRTTTLAECL